MSCEIHHQRLPDVHADDTWLGFTWTLSEVSADDSNFAAVLATATFTLYAADGSEAMHLTSAVAGQVTLEETAAEAWSVTVEALDLGLAAGDYTWRFRTIDADGISRTLLSGTQKIL